MFFYPKSYRQLNPIRLIILLFLSSWLYSCSDSFLEKDHLPDLHPTADTLFITNETGPFTVDIDMQFGNRTWRLYQFPQWLRINPKEGHLNDGTVVSFNCSLDHEKLDYSYGLYYLPLNIEIEGIGIVERTIAYFDFGDPKINLYPEFLKLESELNGEISISNKGEGLLMWEIVEKPDWISFDTTSGMYLPNSIYQIKYTVDVSGLEPGDYQGELVIENNDNAELRYQVNLTVSPFTGNGVYQDGELVDTKFLPGLNKVVALTKNPNRLMYFSVDGSEPFNIELDRLPRCMSLSENKATLAIGFSNAEISTYSANNGNLINTYSLGAVPISLEFGSEDYLYFLSSGNYSANILNSLNLIDKNIISSESEISGIQTIKKVPNKNILVTTKPGWSPDYLIFSFYTNLGVTDSINEYPMSANGFWLSDDGEKIFTGSEVVYGVPEYTPNKPWSYNERPPVLGEFEISDNHVINCIAHQGSKQLFFVATQKGYYDPETVITQYHHSTFVKKEEYEFTSIRPYDYPPGNTWWAKTINMYPAADEAGLWLVQKYPASDYNNPDMWGVRLLQLD